MGIPSERAELIGLADLRQKASEVVKRVQDGSEFVVTVSGHPAAKLVGLPKRTWMSGEEAGALLSGLPAWGARERRDHVLDDDIHDPWEPQP